MSFFAVKGLSAGYGGEKILEDVSFEVQRGSVTGILGANGSGKTTLLKAICGVLPHEGECLLEDRRLEGLNAKRLARLCGYIPQRSGIFIDISVLDVVLMGFNPRLGLLQYPDGEMKRRAREALRLTGLEGMEDRNYLHLSEGQKQLCILARTLAADTELLLLDEPESALDFDHRHRMLALIRAWVVSQRRGALVTLHDPMLALNSCDRLILLSQGRILDELCPSEDAIEHMERCLSAVYGRISLHRCKNRGGIERLVMLREEG